MVSGHGHQGKLEQPNGCNIGQYLWKILEPYHLQVQLSLFSIHQLYQWRECKMRTPQ
ncbi:DEHA2F07810p [Debaryomyces hansenii CBS767]|uniref:DEHA2F07810p n=1 Tax=Debaryomyces hansenii (strain ATCC 36239 / CBS 767 / BCRC 21394 / JCM 1990 / NBRC 0083 / IGC 2968) TaxID=284592 RepID=W0TYT1_DEBHA|nr:DEHA2F07810p [Debaryomyces hansenii CBS767]CAG89039.4 DEHA2F07810p [Debaryomyces hansenii CBS767]|eukprot:XP_002770769.1 DEHA2F07810p [Debaryomyces hansenii CBS767]